MLFLEKEETHSKNKEIGELPMETTPNDLRQQQFEIKFRGYNPDDVEVFRDLAATALEETRAEGLKLAEENRHLKVRLDHLLSLEETLKAAIMEAQKNAETTIATAKGEAEATVSHARKEAELIVREAHLKRDEVVSDMHRQMSQLVGDINKIRFIRSNYLTKMKVLVRSQLETIEQAATEESESGRTHAEPSRETAPIPIQPSEDKPVEPQLPTGEE